MGCPWPEANGIHHYPPKQASDTWWAFGTPGLTPHPFQPSRSSTDGIGAVDRATEAPQYVVPGNTESAPRSVEDTPLIDTLSREYVTALNYAIAASWSYAKAPCGCWLLTDMERCPHVPKKGPPGPLLAFLPAIYARPLAEAVHEAVCE